MHVAMVTGRISLDTFSVCVTFKKYYFHNISLLEYFAQICSWEGSQHKAEFDTSVHVYVHHVLVARLKE